MNIRLDPEAIKRVKFIQERFRRGTVPVEISATAAVNAALKYTEEKLKKER